MQTWLPIATWTSEFLAPICAMVFDCFDYVQHVVLVQCASLVAIVRAFLRFGLSAFREVPAAHLRPANATAGSKRLL
jgi:hypothetical protein